MRTLDEVIKAVEEDFECAKYSYPETFYDYDNHKDALHYLKEFKVVTDICHKHGIASLWGQVLPDVENTDWDKKLNFDSAFDNYQLTWDELKQMKGKPVWMEYEDGKGGWVIVGKFFSLFEHEELDAYVYMYYLHNKIECSKELYGSYWKAYRKERK